MLDRVHIGVGEGSRFSCDLLPPPANRLAPVAKPVDEPFVRHGQRATEVENGDPYRYQVRGLKRPPRHRSKSSAGLEAAERARLRVGLEERATRLRSVGGGSGRGGPVARWTPDRIIVVLRTLADTLGRPPTMADLQARPRSSWPSPSRVRIVFGSWNAALTAAGLPLNATGHPRRQVWSDEEILRAIRDASAADDPGQRPFREGRRRPWLATITIRFGSWSVAQSLALGNRMNDEA